MRPTPIPAEEMWPGSFRVVIAAPNGRLDDPMCAPVEVLMDRGQDTGLARASVRCALEPGDLDKLAAGGTVWVSFYGQVPMFSVDVVEPVGWHLSAIGEPAQADLDHAAGHRADEDPAERELREAGYDR